MSRFSPHRPLGHRSVGIPLALALVCLRSLFQDGYLLQVDAVFGPRALRLEAGSAPRSGCSRPQGSSCSAARGPDVSGPSARSSWRASPRWSCSGARAGSPRRPPPVLAVLNPWVYDRFVEGQWGVLNAASGLFLWIAAWEGLKERPGPCRRLCSHSAPRRWRRSIPTRSDPRRPRARRCALDPDLATSASARVVRRIPRLPRSVAGVSSDLVLRRRRAVVTRPSSSSRGPTSCSSARSRATTTA